MRADHALKASRMNAGTASYSTDAAHHKCHNSQEEIRVYDPPGGKGV